MLLKKLVFRPLLERTPYMPFCQLLCIKVHSLLSPKKVPMSNVVFLFHRLNVTKPFPDLFETVYTTTNLKL